MQWNVWTAPSIRCWRQIVGIGFTRYFEHGNGDFFLYFRTRSEPFGIRPRFNHFFGISIAIVHFGFDIMESIKHQQSVFQAFGCSGSQFVVIQQFNQSGNIVTTQHGTQQFGGQLGAYQWALYCAFSHSSQERRFDFSSIIHTRRHAVGQQIHQEFTLTGWWVFQEFNQFSSLLSWQRQRNGS